MATAVAKRRKAEGAAGLEQHRDGRFYRMAALIPPGTSGNVVIDHFTVGTEPQFRAMMHPNEYVTPGDYCRLRINGRVVMSDTDHERRTNREAVMMAKGDVLIAGLGIGMIALPIMLKPEVSSVTIIEKSMDVCRLVTGAVIAAADSVQAGAGAKLRVIQADIHDWRPNPKARVFDAIYFDIWTEQSTDDVEPMQRLHRAFRPYLRKGGWIDSWNYEELRDRRRQRGRW
jgi:hypothetical protein